MRSARLEAFSDGVFAIAITLLVLEVRVPEAEPGRLAAALLHEWPSCAGYVASFMIIGIIWVNHHAMFEQIRRVDRMLLFLNLLLLMCVSFIPFPTALLADYVRAGHDQRVAALVYGGTMTAMGLAFSSIWSYARSRKLLLRQDLAPDHAAAISRQYWLGSLVYACSMGVALVSASLTLVLYGLLAIFFSWRGIPYYRGRSLEQGKA